MRANWVIAGVFLLISCGEAETREGALTADEEQQLNEAAAMLDKTSDGLAPDDMSAPEPAKSGEDE